MPPNKPVMSYSDVLAILAKIELAAGHLM
jgi:hypothetical protein